MTTANTAQPGGEVVLYRTDDGKTRLEVKFLGESVWLTQKQMAELFEKDVRTVNEHILNVYEEGELAQESTLRNFRIVQTEGKRQVERDVAHYSLDVIISTGYRVKSARGTQFRIWATRTLRDHLVQGYTLNERRLREKGLTEMEQAVRLLARTLSTHELVNEQGRAVLDVVTRYARSWRLLLQYDENRLPESPARPTRQLAGLSLGESRRAISGLKQDLLDKGEATALFGQERGAALGGILGSIEQTFGGEPLYPSVEARAAHLLYFVIKDHPFADGNKRIGSFLFLSYLDRNGLLTKPDGIPRFADNALVAVALMVAESDPAHKELMIRLILNLLQDGSE